MRPALPHRTAACTGLLIMLSLPAATQAQAGRCGTLADGERFAALHDNYLLVHQMRNNGWADRDERALRGQVSVKYSIANCPQRRDKDSRALQRADDPEAVGATRDLMERLSGVEVFVSYTNRFDFYLGSRDSGPVINRVSNPGLHLRLPPGFFSGKAGNGRDSWQISFEHLSNGQVVEPVGNPRDRLLAQRAYEARDHRFFDTISRGMNFVAVQGEWVWALGDDSNDGQGPKLDLRAKAKAYVGDTDSGITWGPLAGQGLGFANYERFKLRLGLYWPGWGRFELTSELGDSGLKHASHTVSWQKNVPLGLLNAELPLFVQAHVGPMNTLSNYAQRQDSIGVGIRVAY